MTRECARLPVASDDNQRLQVEYRRLDELKIDSRNAREHSSKQIRQIAESIKAFGFNVPVLVDDNYKVRAGVARLLAAQRLGLPVIPTIKLSHLSEAQLKAFTLADNRLSELSEWNDQILAEQLRDLSLLDLEFDIEVIGFDVGEIDFRIQGLDHVVDEAAEVIPPMAEVPVSHIGDVWGLGRHRLACGNALDSATYHLIMGDHLAHAALTDPPYNVLIRRNVSGLGEKLHREFPMASGEMNPEQFTGFLTAGFREIARCSVAGSLHYYFMDWRHLREALTAGTEVYDEFINLAVWAKTNPGMGSLYRSQHELVLIFKKAGAAHVNNIQLGKYGRNRSNVWNYPGMNTFARSTDEGNLLHLHPTVKPIKLLADAILDCTKRGNIVLDPFLGSGSTLIAAEKTGRRCFGIELDPLYVDTIIRRWEAYTGDKAKHLTLEKTFDEVALLRGHRHAG